MRGKTKEAGLTEADIIFSDKELEPIFRQLIEKGAEKGYCKSNVAKALVMKWDDIQPYEKTVMATNTEEQAFCRKVDEFIERYKNLLVIIHDEVSENREGRIRGKERSVEWFLKRTRNHLCAAYCAYRRERSFGRNRIEYYANMMGLNKYILFPDDIVCVNKLITMRLMYDREDGYKPKYADARNESLVPLRCVPGFSRFHERAGHRRTTYSEGIMNSIWVIDTFIPSGDGSFVHFEKAL